MIHAEEMQHAVQHEDADFLLRRVPELAGLRAGAGEGDGDVAETCRCRQGNDSTSVA